MKKEILLSALLLQGWFLCAQDLKEQEVPAPVKNKFNSLYPGATKVEWEKEDNNFEVEFKKDGHETTAMFDASGNFLESETEINISELPKAVSEYFAKNLPGKKYKEASKNQDSAGKIKYEVEVKEDEYYFDESGSFLEKKLGKDEKDEKDDD